jgi:uncharacterized protein involved in cysteine biosynthesis
MSHMFKAMPVAFRMIFKDPVNLLLALFPTLIALAIYFYTALAIFRHSDSFISTIGSFLPVTGQTDVMAKVLAVILIIFIFLVMSWSFIVVVGIVSAPFNPMLSSRIEKKLTENKQEAMHEIRLALRQTFKNEFKKLIFITLIAIVGFIANLFPPLYPVGFFLFAMLLSVQFIDYSWSRHDMHFGACLQDLMVNIIPYSISGLFFLLLVTVPIVNACIPALATSYYTVLWLQRQNKIQL